jgi:Protein of unknown function (DUF1579)
MGGLDETDTSEVSHESLATAVLESEVGVWDADVEIRPSPTAEPQYQKGVSTRAMVGGRWLVVDYKTYGGYAGHGIYGWDSSAQRYAGVWVDNMSSAIARVTARYDPAAREMHREVELVHGGRTLRYREVQRALHDDTELYEQYVPLPGGGEHAMVKVTYRRRGG